MKAQNILVLGGTRDALELAALLHGQGFSVTTSLAGVTANPATPMGALRVGGFGGLDGLIAYARNFDLIADATHPFAAKISAHGHAAAAALRIPYARLERPEWVREEGDHWTPVPTIAAAATVIPAASPVLLTIGRKELAPFLARGDLTGIIRMIEEPACAIPASFTLLRAKPPFTLESEIALITNHGIKTLVTKNAGGAHTSAKITAARQTATPVIMIARPEKPAAQTLATAEEFAALIAAR